MDDPLRTIRGIIRLGHPLPTSIATLTTAAIAIVGGAIPARAMEAGIAMAALQASIGAYNDLVDAPVDARVKPAKPIPAGEASRSTAAGLAIGGLVVGLAMALVIDPVAFALATAGVACGYVHSRWTKGTWLAPLPFALGISLLPAFAWVAAVGSLPPSMAILIALGSTAGLAIGLANGLADIERDRAAGVGSLAVRLGVDRSRRVIAAAVAIVIGGSGAAIWFLGEGGSGLVVVAVGWIVLLVGFALVWRPQHRPDLGWEVMAIGMGVLVVGWLGLLAGDAS